MNKEKLGYFIYGELTKEELWELGKINKNLVHICLTIEDIEKINDIKSNVGRSIILSLLRGYGYDDGYDERIKYFKKDYAENFSNK